MLIMPVVVALGLPQPIPLAEQPRDRRLASVLCALHAGAPFGYADWLGLFALAALGNLIGGLGLVTLLRLLQVPHKVLAQRHAND
ncbi:MAG: hypothetical protein ACRDSZ_09060 [Pseudonocardiaceae bacterium]